MNARFAVVTLYTCALVGFGLAADDPAQAIRQLENAWNQDYAAKDAAKLVAHYAAAATLMAPGMPASHGKDAIAKVLKDMITDPAMSLKFHAGRIEVAKGGDMAFTQGTYTLTMTNPVTRTPMTDKGSYVTIYQKQVDGSWKAVSDIASSEMPPAPPAK